MTKFIIQGALIVLGLTQALGYVGNMSSLRNWGLASTAAPLPLVFTSFRGLETFSSKFTIVIEFDDQSKQSFEMTPQLYGRLDGPYNRRNIYGAAFAYGTRMNSAPEIRLVQNVLQYGFCFAHSPFVALAPDRVVQNVEIQVENRASTAPYQERLRVSCPR